MSGSESEKEDEDKGMEELHEDEDEDVEKNDSITEVPIATSSVVSLAAEKRTDENNGGTRFLFRPKPAKLSVLLSKVKQRRPPVSSPSAISIGKNGKPEIDYSAFFKNGNNNKGKNKKQESDSSNKGDQEKTTTTTAASVTSSNRASGLCAH